MKKELQKLFSSPISVIKTVSGGCINQAFCVQTTKRKYFLKTNHVNQLSNFQAEHDGLELLAKNSQFILPKVYKVGILADFSFLLMQWIEPAKAKTLYFWHDFAEKLADLHRHSCEYFGLNHDNFIGSLPQSNKQHRNWHNFYIEQRLIPQVKLAFDAGLLTKQQVQQFSRFYLKLPQRVPTENPALLHGDLWSGNYLCMQHTQTRAQAQPVLIDPSVYYGHRETELAFMQMFGGFDAELFNVYHEIYPLEKGFQQRIGIHQLYPNLVHLNLFSISYLPAILRTLKNN